MVPMTLNKAKLGESFVNSYNMYVILFTFIAVRSHYKLMCCEFMWIQKELMKCKLHANDRYKTYLTWLLWSVEVILTKKEMCKLNLAEVIR